jgi:hypothetical protein
MTRPWPLGATGGGKDLQEGYSDSPMRVTKANVAKICAVCERTLLMGEQTYRFSPGGGDYVDVCPLCQETALEQGWIREGLSATPGLHASSRRRKQKSLWQTLLGARDEPVADPVVSEPILRRLSDDEIALVEAADLFNASQFRRTVAGVSKSLGPPQASIVPLSGVSGELVITFAWDISWYQYRITPEAAQPVRMAERGQDMDDLESAFVQWNAMLTEDGRVVPDLVHV